MKRVHFEYGIPEDFQGVWERTEELHTKDGRWYLSIDDREFYELTEKEAVEWMQKNSYNGLVYDVLNDFHPELLPVLAEVRAGDVKGVQA